MDSRDLSPASRASQLCVCQPRNLARPQVPKDRGRSSHEGVDGVELGDRGCGRWLRAWRGDESALGGNSRGSHTSLPTVSLGPVPGKNTLNAGVAEPWAQRLSLDCYAALHQSLNISGPQFPHGQQKSYNPKMCMDP